MEFKLPRQKISQKLIGFAYKKMRKEKFPSASKNQLTQLARVSEEIQKEGLPSYLVLKKLKGKIGYGIFLHPQAKPILKGEVVAAYAGEVYLAPQNQGESSDYAFSLLGDLVLTREEQLLSKTFYPYHPRRLYSLDLDADQTGNFTRFINHSEKPNIEAHLLKTSSDGFELLYLAKKIIRPGEQLLVSYEGEGKSYWGALQIKPFPMTPQTFRLDEKLKLV